MALSDITEYSVSVGTTNVESLAFRKCRRLLSVELPEGLLVIGDAAFSLCDSLRHIEIPSSVECIGVAAFCHSGLECIQFLGIPKVIETGVFEGCEQLKEIIVPKGSRDVFIRKFSLPAVKVVERIGRVQVVRPTKENIPAPHSHSPSEMRTVRSMRFSYNARYFNWAIGDNVDLRTVFSGPITLAGPVTYEFRRKVLFIFVKSAAARTLEPNVVYELPANSVAFTRKFKEKYTNRSPRIFIFKSDDGRTAKFLDEVKLIHINKDSIMVKSLLKVL